MHLDTLFYFWYFIADCRPKSRVFGSVNKHFEDEHNAEVNFHFFI